MIATPNLSEILGAEVVDPNNDSVGKVGRIYLDAERDVPTWVSVRTGLFGLSETLVPVDDANWEGQVLHVTVDKGRIKDAPRVDVDQEIAPEDQERLYSYYDRDWGAGATGGSGDYGSSTAGYGGSAGQGRHADRSGGLGGDAAGAGGMGAAGAGLAGAGAAGMGTAGTGAAGGGGAGMGADTMGSSGGGAEAISTSGRDAGGLGGSGRGAPDRDEPLGGGNQNPAAYDGEWDQRIREAGRTAGSGQLGGGNQSPELFESDEVGAAGGSNLGGGNQDPDRFDGGENRSGATNLGGGAQDPGGPGGHTGVDASSLGGPGESTGAEAGAADASRRAAAQDDPGRMQLSDEGMNAQPGGAMRMSGDQPQGMTGSGSMADQQGGVRRDVGEPTGGSGAQAMGATGGMRLRRYVVTEQQTVSMPVTREEFRLEPDEGEMGGQNR